MPIQWEENLRLGVPAIDQQHEEIFVHFRKLSDALQTGKGSEEVIGLLDYLSKYATTHFSDEEDIMLKYNYNGISEQREHHATFKENIAQLSRLLATSEPTKEIAFKTDATLIRYFIQHVRKLDRKMVEVLKPLMAQ
jgi:hemerythrin